MMFRYVTLPLAAAFLLAGCDAEKFDAASEQQKLLQRDAEWSEAASSVLSGRKTCLPAELQFDHHARY
jgi:hypothetical protein